MFSTAHGYPLTMFDFHEKRRLRTYLYSPVVVVVLLLLTAVLSVSVYERFTIEREMAERREAAEAELAELQARADALQEQVEHLNNERGIEEELRSRFDVAKEGEQVVVIIDDEERLSVSLDELAVPPGSETESERGFFWWLPW